MFDLFRRAKAMRILFFGIMMIMTVSMVTYLIPGFGVGDQGQDQVVAEIGKEVLTVRDVQQQMQAAMRNRSVPSGATDIYAQQLIENMINTRAMIYEAKRIGLSVSDEELAKTLRAALPQLFPNGQFIGKETYAAVLQQQGMTIPEFEADLRSQMLLGRMTSLASDGVIITPQDLAREYTQRNETAKLQYIVLSPAKYKSEVSLTPADVRSYFQTHSGQYRVPEERNAQIVLVDEAKVGQKITIPEDQLRAIYEQNKDQYRVPERVHVRHILLKTTDKPKEDIPKIQAHAEELLKELKAGADFAELAKKNSEDPGSAAKGGDLGWIVRGQTVPAFENAAFSLKPKELSGVIKTEYGFHILQVLEKEDARVKPFDEVKDEIAQERKKQQVFDTMQQLADQAHDELVKHPQQAAEIANRLGLTLIQADNLTANGPIPELGKLPDLSDAIFGLQAGGVTQVMQAQGNKLVVAAVTNIVPARPAELTEVEGTVREQALREKLRNMVGQVVRETMSKANASQGDLEKVAKQMGLEVKTTQDFKRDGAADGIGSAALLMQAFRDPVGTVFGPVFMGDQQFVCKIVARTLPDMAKLDSQRAELQAAIKEQKGRQRVALFMDSVLAALIRDGKVKIHTGVRDRLLASYRG